MSMIEMVMTMNSILKWVHLLYFSGPSGVYLLSLLLLLSSSPVLLSSSLAVGFHYLYKSIPSAYSEELPSFSGKLLLFQE